MYGTHHEEDANRLVAIVDRHGYPWARFTWSGARLVSLTVPGAVVDGAVIQDELLGAAHAIYDGRGREDERERDPSSIVTTMSALDWLRPTELPIVAAPGRLPVGAGGPILNAIAVLAARAGVPALRYAGPYPTPALFRTLTRSFRTAATEDDFSAELLVRATRLARDPIAIDFVPAPSTCIAVPGGHVELREGVERCVLELVAYEPGGSPARLVAGDAGARAEVWFGDAPYAHVATFAPDGALVDGPHPIPPSTSPVLGKPFPPELAAALAELVADAVPAPLAADTRAWLAARPLRWADLGARAAADRAELLVHAALWDRIAPLGLARLALALTEALAPLAARAVIAAVTARLSTSARLAPRAAAPSPRR